MLRPYRTVGGTGTGTNPFKYLRGSMAREREVMSRVEWPAPSSVEGSSRARGESQFATFERYYSCILLFPEGKSPAGISLGFASIYRAVSGGLKTAAVGPYGRMSACADT